MATSWVPDRAPALHIRLSTCFSTVRGETWSRAAISLFARPSATSTSTSASRAVTPSAVQRLGGGPPSSSALHAITAPALILTGDRDPFCTVEEGAAAYRALPAGELAVLPDTGHLVTRAAVQTVIEFFERL